MTATCEQQPIDITLDTQAIIIGNRGLSARGGGSKPPLHSQSQTVVFFLKLLRYDNTGSFCANVLDVLLEHEVQNNLLISLITNDHARFAKEWFLGVVVGDGGGIALTAIYISPFDLLLFETGNNRNDDAVELLARELRKIGCRPPGVMASADLARRFADAHKICAHAVGAHVADAHTAGTHTVGAHVADAHTADALKSHMTQSAMRLDKLEAYLDAPGSYRAIEKRDMFFAPYWERAFSEEIRSNVFSIEENVRRLKTRIGKNMHFIWEDGVPVSQAVHGRDTPNGAIINGVYTPPHYRGRGYACSVVAALAGKLLESGKDFCCLFADVDNPVSCGVYKKLGFYDVYTLEIIRFDISE